MELQWLKTFVVAADTCNFRKTAEILMISQPGVSVHIKLLEGYLGIQLFERAQNRVRLTEAGKMYVQEAQQLVQHFEQSIVRVHNYAEGYLRNWKIAISPLMAETILPYLLRSFMSKHPDLDVTIQVEESHSIEELVDSGKVNIGISALDASRKHIKSFEMYEDPLLFITPVDGFDEESGPPIDVEEYLTKNYLFTHHHPMIWDSLLLQLRKHLPALRTMKVTQANVAKRFIQEGLGASFLPKSIVKREIIEGRVMQVPFPIFELPTVSTYILVKDLGNLEKEFIDKMQTHYFG